MLGGFSMKRKIIFGIVVTILAIALLIFIVKVLIPWLFGLFIKLIVIIIVLVIFAFALNH